MKKQDTIKPIDLVVALSLTIKHIGPLPTYSQLGLMLGISPSTAFGAVKRLQVSGLLRPGTYQPNIRELRNFLVHGAKHAFPPSLGKEVRGIPTAHAGPPLKEMFDSATPVVWPDPHGPVRGMGLTPLYPKAVALPDREPALYNILTLVDAVRVGQARERNAALAAIDKLFGTADDQR